MNSTATAFIRPRRPARLGRLGATGLGFALPVSLFLLVAFDVPVLMMFGWALTSAKGMFAPFVEFFTRPAYIKVILNTLRIAAIATVSCAVLGYVLAYWLRSLSGTARLVALTLVVLPFWVSILVRSYAWIVVLGNNGVVNRALLDLGLASEPVAFLYNDLGVVIGTTNLLLPFLVLPLYAAMIRIDGRILQAAETLGASRWTIFRRIFFPLTVPALAAGMVLVFILTLGFYVTPAILGGGRVPMVANMLDMLINRLPRWELASAISILLLILTLLLHLLYVRLSRQAGN
ncbi:MAG TPA: ABC transporter permease [Geminicoccus sp.]|uniref:ABC transporter permease n=1 Tax=Geminicoccus sp. TaxID=2024832 RepID=UPI002BA1608A|nr:ABC transporter permease [Geminicoccus sp.]HWL67468.1 ABC transporter permease [Geminicoccus sp.]